MAVISINYNESSKKKDLDYKSVRISYSNLKKTKIFNSGSFVKDWYDCNKFVITKLSGKEHIMHSSTVNHFIMDGAKFDSAYLIEVEEKPALVYKYNDEGIEFFVVKGTKPTWLELRSLCGNPSKAKQKV